MNPDIDPKATELEDNGPGTGVPDYGSRLREGEQQSSRSPLPQRQHHKPPGWSLQDSEYESWEDEQSITSSQSSRDSRSQEEEEDINDQLRALQDCVESNYKDFLYACGGSIPIILENEESPSPKESQEKSSRPGSAPNKSPSASVSAPTSHLPVVLRWDPQDVSTPASQSKLVLPAQKTSDDNLKNLLAEMQPATFGFGGEDVYDESYRKASKLEPQHFSTNFCPYSSGIIEIISQLLLPDPDSEKQRTIKAELYKLNVYTGPSGHFRSHVDTPRSQAQFGSLVVCLPVKHEGGTLEVRHHDEIMSFDWAPSSEKSEIQWAAFYSDCEHEVFPVHSGHRITLTYNLYATQGNARLLGSSNALDDRQTPIYTEIKALVDDETFLPDGGYLGFYTTHSYPHNTTEGCIAETLKGLDMVIWRAFQHLGCGVCLRPVLATSPFLGEEISFEVGKNFKLDVIDYQVESPSEWENLIQYAWGLERISSKDIVWLNQPTLDTKQAAFTFAVYGNEAHGSLAYTICSIIIGVPKFHEGRRTRLASTYETRFEEGDWEVTSPYDV